MFYKKTGTPRCQPLHATIRVACSALGTNRRANHCSDDIAREVGRHWTTYVAPKGGIAAVHRYSGTKAVKTLDFVFK